MLMLLAVTQSPTCSSVTSLSNSEEPGSFLPSHSFHCPLSLHMDSGFRIAGFLHGVASQLEQVLPQEPRSKSLAGPPL